MKINFIIREVNVIQMTQNLILEKLKIDTSDQSFSPTKTFVMNEFCRKKFEGSEVTKHQSTEFAGFHIVRKDLIKVSIMTLKTTEVFRASSQTTRKCNQIKRYLLLVVDSL